MTTSTDLLLGRRRELHQLIRAAIENYATEIGQIDKMLAAAGVAVRPELMVAVDGGDKDESSGPRNVRGQILAVLAGYPEGLKTREITEKVNMRFGREIKPRNMSWHVSHLKRDGELANENNLWLIPSKQARLVLDDVEKENTNQTAV